MKRHSKILSLVATALLLTMTSYCFARAGGGGGLGVIGGGSILTTILAIIIAPFFIIYSVIVSLLLKRKQNKVRQLTDELVKADKIWNYRDMMATVEQVFFKVQKAWMERNQDLAREVMSDRIYQKHKFQTDEMIANGTKNVLEKINLAEIMIISLEDYKDNSADTFSVYLTGTMVDYTVNAKTLSHISGDSTKPEDFKEIWTFIRDRNKWILDEIDQEATLGDISRGKAFREKNEGLM